MLEKSVLLFVNGIAKTESLVCIALTFEEFAHKFYPMQADCVKHDLHHIHNQEYAQRHSCPNTVSNEKLKQRKVDLSDVFKRVLTPIIEPFASELDRSISKKTFAS